MKIKKSIVGLMVVSAVVVGLIVSAILVKLIVVSAWEGTLYESLTIEHGGLTRSYHLYVPNGLPTSPVPLVFLLHGGGANINDFIGLGTAKAPFRVWLDIADLEKFIVAVPQGVNGYWHDCREDCTQNCNKDVDDVGFINALITTISSSYNIDAERIYATGISNGGHLSYRVARELSDKIAAIGVIVANMAANNSCNGPVNPISVLIMDGTADPLSPWTGGTMPAGRGTVLSTYESVNFWVNHNGANTTPTYYDFPDGPYDDSSTVTKETYDNGVQGTEVVLYRVNGGGHAEPSILQQYSSFWETIVGKQNHDIEMAEEVWSFFKKHGLNGPISSPSVGGVVVSVDKFGSLAPYIGLTSTLVVATVATAIYVKRVKRRKEKQ